MQTEKAGYKDPIYIAGVDEAGRGPLAGPVIAAAVILPHHHKIPGIRDSKSIAENKRKTIAQNIKMKSISWAIGRADVEEIDSINILQASLLAMKRAVEALDMRPTQVLVDGNQRPNILFPTETIIKGDQKVAVISAASILAKVARDEEMIILDRDYPEYGFARHKGYPTRTHILALKEYGATPVHRRSFRPVMSVCKNNFT